MNAHATPELQLPANIEAEAGVLGAILLNNELMHAVSFLRAEHFDEIPHQAIFEAMKARIADDRPASVMTLASDLPPFSDPEITAQAYLAHLAASAWTVSEQVTGIARELVILSAKRNLARLGASIAINVNLPGASIGEVISETELELIQLSDEIGQLTAPKEASPNTVLSEINDRMTSGRHFKGIQTGLVAIDNRLGGLAAGEVIVIAGRPGMGKTAVALSMARRMAHIGVGVGFDSIEMTKSAVWHRLLSDEALASEAIPYKNIGRGKLTPGQYQTIDRANRRLKDAPLVILDRGNRLSDLPGHIRAARRFLKRKHNTELQVFIVDYLGILRPGDRYAGQKVNEVGEISATIKALAKRENIAVIALHQLSRANETRGEDRRPRLSDLRDSGALEQDADVVMFVYRDAYYIERPGYRNFEDDIARQDALAECAHRLEVIVAKQRQGEIGTCRLWCDPATNSVRDEAR